MAESWRDTLDEADAALSVDQISAQLSRIKSNARSAPSPRMRPRLPLRSHSGAEARKLLERELAAVSVPPVPVQETAEPASQRPWRAPIENRQPAPLPPRLDAPPSGRPQKRHASLMAALAQAIPDLPAVEEGAVAEEAPVPHPKSPKRRRPWRHALVISISATVIAVLAARSFVSRNEIGGVAEPRGRPAAVEQAMPTPVKLTENSRLNVPLPSRRPSRLLRDEQQQQHDQPDPLTCLTDSIFGVKRPGCR